MIINCLVEEDDSEEDNLDKDNSDEDTDLDLEEEEPVGVDEYEDDVEDEETEENNRLVDYDSEENEVGVLKCILNKISKCVISNLD